MGMNFKDARWTAGGLRFWKDVSDGTLDACRGRHLHNTNREKDDEPSPPPTAAAAAAAAASVILVILPRKPARRELLVRGDLKPRAAREEVSINDIPTT